MTDDEFDELTLLALDVAGGTAPVHVSHADVGSPDWNEARRATINGSEIAAVLGISPYESPFSLWHRKAGHLGDTIETPEMFWGKALEGVIRGEFARRHATEFVTWDGGGLWRHPDREWQGGSPDGRLCVAERRIQPSPMGLLECKTDRYGDRWGTEGTDEIPVHYRAQCLWYLDVFGLQVCHVAVLIAGSEYREYRIEHDDDELVPMRAAARAFLDSLAGPPPPLDGSDATYQAVRELHPDVDPESVELDDTIARPYLLALAGCKTADVEKRLRSCEVIEVMGRAQYATWIGDRIASRIPPRSEGGHPYLRAHNGAADLLRGDTA